MNENVWPLILLGGGLLAFLLVVSFLSKNYSLNNFKSKTVGDGQHGTARVGNAQGDQQNIPDGTVPSPPLAQERGAAYGAGTRPRQRRRQKP